MTFRICLFVVLSLALFAAANSKAAARNHPKHISSALADPARPADAADLIFTSMNYHDL
jgi:hypothetical protein